MNDYIPILNGRDQEEPPSSSSIVDYHRLPQVWQCRALNFNKNISKNLNAGKCCIIEKTNSKMKIKHDINNFCYSSESTRSITSNSSSLMCLSTEHLIKPTNKHNRYHHYRHHYNNKHNQRLYKSAMNLDQRSNYYKTSKIQNPYFIRLDNQYGQPTKYFHTHQMHHKLPSSRDIRDYYTGIHHQTPSYSWFPSATYFYPTNVGRNHTIFQLPTNHGYHPLYSSQTFYPGAYFPTTTSSTAIYPRQPMRMSYSQPYTKQLPTSLKSEFNSKNQIPTNYHHHHHHNQYNSQKCKLLSKTSTNTNGHIIVLVVILSVIAIGVVMGLILAITIN
ncbi:hypothetical protein HUG17_5437 [Dermatophagoides farinae]|uniref:Uncharacterized protein n=2 Tax=Dermatophagoides farinae TaxID=6954 RepID=A0A9D4P1Q1_DERFA|nr:hypothetical protein HUG17_5437 [Dermatophagoides farinae]